MNLHIRIDRTFLEVDVVVSVSEFQTRIVSEAIAYRIAPDAEFIFQIEDLADEHAMFVPNTWTTATSRSSRSCESRVTLWELAHGSTSGSFAQFLQPISCGF